MTCLRFALVSLLICGCDSKDEDGKGRKHEHRAPHGGTLVEFGEEFAHLELVFEEGPGKITAYVLDGEAEKPVKLPQMEFQIAVKGKSPEFTVALKAVGNPLTGEKEGETSQFEGQSDSLKGLRSFDATVRKITVKGREFADVPFNFPKGNEEK